MKKIYLSIILCMVVIAFATSFTHAAGALVESPNVKVVIDGVVGTYTDVPIVLNGRTLLPLRAILTNLGVSDDNQHIFWNDVQRSITIYKDTKRVYLKIDSNTAYVNDEQVMLDVPPVIYKNRTYIPARFISQVFGKKVVWDGSLNAILIRDEAEFNRIKEIIEKTDTAMNAINKTKFNMEMDMAVVQSVLNIGLNVKVQGEVDKEKKLSHTSMDMMMLGQSSTSESYCANGASYEKINGKWKKTALTQEEYDKLFTDNKDINMLDPNDALCAGLVESQSENTDEILLKGVVYIDELLGQVGEAAGVSQKQLSNISVEITIDKDTNIVKNIYMDFGGDVETSLGKMKFTSKVTLTYRDINGAFEIEIPKQIEENVIEE